MDHNEYRSLCEQIRHHNELYYNQDAPEISDFEYDALMRRLKEAEKEHPEYVTADSPTQKVGGKRVIGSPVLHRIPMLSLEDVFDRESVCRFVEAVKEIAPDAVFSVEEKIDGLSLSLEYQDGRLVRASTRGDGREGEDVTENVRMMRNVPLEIPLEDGAHIGAGGSFEVRGECYMRYADFKAANEQQKQAGKKLFANPRNCAAGTLRQSDPAIVKERKLELLVFNVQQPNDALAEFDHAGQLQFLEDMGFQCVARKLCADADAVWTAIENLGRNRSGLPYGIDGAVVKVNSIRLRRELGVRSKTPKWAVAYKYPPEEKETVLRDILLQTGRTGRVTPVAVFDGIALAGTWVTLATLHNQGRINELDLRIGDTLVVRKAGDIIPEIVRVSRHADANALPYQMRSCPECGAKLIRETEDGADLYCSNVECPAKLQRRLEFFASKDCMDIDGLGRSTVGLLIQSGKAASPADLYALTCQELEGILGSKRLAEKLVQAISASKRQPAVRLLKALGWRNIGASVAQTLLARYGSIPALFQTSREQLLADLPKLDGLGDTLVASIVHMVEDPGMRTEVERLAAYGLTVDHQLHTAGNILAGKTFVITGTLPTMERRQAQALIEENGGKVTGSVSRNTSYLVAGEAAGSKLEKAQALGIPVLSESELLSMIGYEMRPVLDIENGSAYSERVRINPF